MSTGLIFDLAIIAAVVILMFIFLFAFVLLIVHQYRLNIKMKEL